MTKDNLMLRVMMILLVMKSRRTTISLQDILYGECVTECGILPKFLF